MKRTLLGCLAWMLGLAYWVGAAELAPIRIADGLLRVGLSPANGAIHEIVLQADGLNRIDDDPSPLGLWQITVRAGEAAQPLILEPSSPPRVEPLAGQPRGLRLIWDEAGAGGFDPLRVEVLVRLGPSNAALSRWEVSVAKPRNVRLERVRFPRISSLRPRPNEALAVPRQLGALARNPRALLQGKDRQARRLAWSSPHGTSLSMQCLALYEPNGAGLYVAGDDTQGHRKEFALWGDGEGRLHGEIVHEPEQAALGIAEFRLPFAVVLGAFQGDWTTAAEIYRESPAVREMAERGRLRRGLAPNWLPGTGLWVWNRGRSSQVLDPAIVLRHHLDAPVSVLWHWWHECPYDAGFPEYLPPREGAEPFQAALAAAERQDVRAILYMNQRLWGTTTPSWTREGAEDYAVRTPEGKVLLETYNTYMKAPCAPMCIGTQFWRDKYAGLAQEVLCRLQAAGIYMDQAGVLANCFDSRHGHIPGPGRYWTDGFGMLAGEIRDRSSARGPVALGCEYAGEPWLGHFDLALGLCVSPDRFGFDPAWEPIPFFQAVYHSSALVFGNMAGLAHPPYDEKWPPESMPSGRLTLLDRKFARQFYLEQARTFVWGMQPMLANFLPEHLRERAEEMDFVTRLVRTRMQSLKYLLHGDWLRPPPIAVPQIEIDVATVGIYTPLQQSRRTCPAAVAGAWRAPDGGVGIALATICDEPTRLQLPVDLGAYGLGSGASVCRIDEQGRKPLGRVERERSVLDIELPPRALCVLELCGD